MAKRYIDKSPEEIKKERSAGFKKRMANLARIGESAAEKGTGIATGIVKEEIFGIPGMFADLSGLAQYATNPFTYGTNEALQKASEDLIDDLGASALAAKAGVELSDEMFDEDGEIRPEMIGRMLAPGALYGKGAALIPELSSGVQSLVRGLRNEGFFPAGGPQPATVGGPSPMTQAPDDSGPRSMVVRSEALGAGRSASNDNQKIADEIYDYVVGTESPDAIRQLFEEGSNEVATDFLKFSRDIDEVMDPQPPEVMRILQDRFREDTRAALAERFGFDPENFSMDTPVTVYRVGDIKKGEPQSFSLDPEIGSKNFPLLPGQDRRVKRGEARQNAVEYRVRAGDILAMPQASARGIERLNESEVIIEGGRAKTPVQFEKENTFVSPDNPAVDKPPKSALTMGKGDNEIDIPGMSKTGIYLPLKAALENIDIPKEGITATKLIEKLRGQPRTGRELTSSGLLDFLKKFHSDGSKLTKDQVTALYDGLRGRIVTRTVMDEPFEYDGKVVEGESTVHSGLQRQVGARDTERNYGVMMFGDEAGKIDGVGIQTLPAHDYFVPNLDTFFGHIRFSIQEMLDPKTNQPIKALLVEEIQSDLVRAMAQGAKISRQRKSLDQIRKDLKKRQDAGEELYELQNVTDPEANERILDTQAQLLFDDQDRKIAQAIDSVFEGTVVHTPEDRFYNTIFESDPKIKKFREMKKNYRLSEEQDLVLRKPVMDAIRRQRDIHFNAANDDKIRADRLKLLLTSGLHKARSEDEALEMISKMSGEISGLERTADEVDDFANLTGAERITQLQGSMLDLWRENQMAGAKLFDRLKKKQGPLGRLLGGGTESQLAEANRLAALTDIAKNKKSSAFLKLTHEVTRRFKDGLREAYFQDLDANRTEEFFDMPDLNQTSRSFIEPGENQTAGRIRYRLTDDEVEKVLSSDRELVDGMINDAMTGYLASLREIDQLDPVFDGLAKRHAFHKNAGEERALRNNMESMMLFELTTSDGSRIKADHYHDNVLKMLNEARQNAPTREEVISQMDEILQDPNIGDTFRSRYDISPDETGVGVAFSTRLDSEADVDGLVNQPPFETQNDYIQFATRALMHEAGKMDIDAVIVPSVEEMIFGRGNHVFNIDTQPQEKIKHIENMKGVLAGEKRLREIKSMVQKLPEMIGRQELEEIGALDELTRIANQDAAFGVAFLSDNKIAKKDLLNIFLSPDRIKENAKILLKKYPYGGDRILDERKLRGHFQNSGEALDAALSGLAKEGFEVEEIEQLSVKTRDGSKYVPIGGYASQGKPELAKYRMIDIRKGNKGADVAKKVPSAYNKGGHVDVRGGIGAMAREVM